MTKDFYDFCSFIYSNFIWLIALLVGVYSAIVPFLNQKEKVEEINSKPENRKEKLGEPDKNGLKQVQAVPSNTSKPDKVPVGTVTETKTTITGEGKLKPINNGNQPGERSAENVLEDLNKVLNRNN